MRQTSHVVIFTKWKGNHNSESGGHLYIVFNSPTPSSHDWFIPSSSSLNAPCAMRHFDLRFCIIVLINMAKSQIGGISWDLITWTNLFCFLLILAAFSFVSNEVPLTLFTCSFRTLHIRLRFGNRPLSAAVSFMASLIFPQPLFWYVYPVLLLLSFYPAARLVDHALRSLQAVIPINQVYDNRIPNKMSRVQKPKI